ncbi:hypothetical protein F511_37732 [Dorcoceras hygrometricum]|uniref:Uncharacterized protein n=1 Tax=Dorcoceras hygrometricum TaxID=472368 RepID=A0A2Z7AAN1_9LAMI|nr:hypothetical protein F511_37732 [Dorcoceras hygrometricum]
MLYLTCAACLDWSRREDIQARTVKGRLSWTGRRYRAGTTSAVERSHALRLLVCDSAVGSKVTDLCCSDLIVAAVCGDYSSEAGFPGYAAGRGYDPAGGAPGGG